MFNLRDELNFLNHNKAENTLQLFSIAALGFCETCRTPTPKLTDAR
jgi:hypothetical protein